MKLAALLLLLPLSTACVSASVTSLNSSYRPPLDPSQVTIYLDPADVPGPYEKVGLIHTKGDSVFTNERQMMEKARKEAAALGANGLLLGGIDEASQGAKVAAQIFGASTNRRGQMIAIYVPPAAPAVTSTTTSRTTRPRTPGETQTFEEWLQEQDSQP